MGMLAFVNKTTWQDGREVIYSTPAQMWWQHAYLGGSEILIASMHSAWYGFGDENDNGNYDIGEEVSPFFYMGASTDEVRNAKIYSNPKAEVIPMQRSVSGSTVTYTWGYNYTDIIFFVPEINRTLATPAFDWGFNYSDPGTYVDGSHHIGNQTYIYYDYTLEIDTTAGEATLYQDFENGEISAMVYRDDNVSSWAYASPGDHWVPTDWAMCLGTYSFIMAGQDWALADLLEGEINRTTDAMGLTEVRTTLGGLHAFDFKFSQKPDYQISNINDSTTGTHSANYQSLDVVHDSEFINFVSGMTELVGPFGRLLVGYVVNQTNKFTHGVPFEEAYNSTDLENMAAFFITCYPEFGMYGGGKLVHDPVFKAYFNPTGAISGYPITILTFTIMIGITVVLISKRRIIRGNK
jgi:hypothetical protein